jgi:hypothetical protein
MVVVVVAEVGLGHLMVLADHSVQRAQGVRLVLVVQVVQRVQGIRLVRLVQQEPLVVLEVLAVLRVQEILDNRAVQLVLVVLGVQEVLEHLEDQGAVEGVAVLPECNIREDKRAHRRKGRARRTPLAISCLE